MERDFESEFAELTKRLVDLAEPDMTAISLLNISMAVERLNEAALYLNRYISKVISVPRDTPVDCPDDMMAILPPLAILCETLSESLHDYVCDCGLNDEDDDEDDEEEM